MIEPILADDEFAGRVCIVTGAARGIGAAIAENLGRRGGTVVVADVRLDGAEERARHPDREGAAREAMRVDVRDADDVDGWSTRSASACGPPSVLVNNAGIVTVAPSDELPVEEWRRQVDVMLSGTFLMTQAVARPMLRRGRWRHRQPELDRRLRRTPGPVGVQRRQGRDLVPDPGAGGRVGGARDPRERRRPGRHAHRDAGACAAHARGRDQARRVRRAHADGPRRRAGGDRRAAWRSWPPTSAVRHRDDAPDRRRLDARRRPSRRRAGVSSYVVTGGTDAFVDQLGGIPAAAGAARAGGDHRRVDPSRPGRRRRDAEPVRRRRQARTSALPRGEGAAFIAVVPGLRGASTRRTTGARRAGRRRRPVARPVADRALVGRGTAVQRRRLRRARHGRDPRHAVARRAGRADADAPAGERVRAGRRDRLPGLVLRARTSPAACSTWTAAGPRTPGSTPPETSRREPHDSPQRTSAPWQDWVRQQLIFTEALRGGPLVWPAGSTHLAGDPLGPVRHAHDDAAEYYYVLSGACMVEVGGEERVANTGDLVYIPDERAPQPAARGGRRGRVGVRAGQPEPRPQQVAHLGLSARHRVAADDDHPSAGRRRLRRVEPLPRLARHGRARRARARACRTPPSWSIWCSRASATCGSAGCPARSVRAARSTCCATSTTS